MTTRFTRSKIAGTKNAGGRAGGRGTSRSNEGTRRLGKTGLNQVIEKGEVKLMVLKKKKTWE